jgi:hypothetical protein
MILQTIKCERRTCTASYTEKEENAGFPHWGHVAGLVNEKGEPAILHICPHCIQELIIFFKGGRVNALG